MSPEDPTADEPVCPRHLGRIAYVRCQRCERPTCPECQRPAAVGIQCVDCVKAARGSARPVVSRLGFASADGPPVVTYALLVAVAVAFIWAESTGSREAVSEYAIAPVVAGEWYRWVTAGFLHADIVHVAMNMFVLWQFGPLVEQLLGRGRFAVLYLVSLLGSSGAVVLLGEDRTAHVGASGAIFGVIAAYIIIGTRLKADMASLVVMAGGWLLLGFVIEGISWEGHLGGAVTGTLVTVAMLRSVERRHRGARL